MNVAEGQVLQCLDRNKPNNQLTIIEIIDTQLSKSY